MSSDQIADQKKEAAGGPTKVMGVEFAPINIPLERRLQTLSVIHFIFAFLIMPIVCSGFMVYVLFTSFWWLTVLYGIWFMYDFTTPRRGSYRWERFRNASVWKYLAAYFPAKLIKTAELGAIEVSRDSIQHTLRSARNGQAVVIVIGGAMEALEARPNHFTLHLSRRKGFVKLAMQEGADLVPVFSFGENDLFEQVENPEGSFLRSFQVWFKNHAGFSPPVFSGRGIFNYTFGLLPFRKPINTVVGAAIPVKKNPNPSREEVNEVHQTYIKALMDTFEANKEKYGVSQDLHITIL